MIINRIETPLAPTQAVARIFTSDGLEGIGQTGCFKAHLTANVLHELVAPYFLGRNPWDVQTLIGQCLTKIYKFSRTFLYRALCGVDTAIYDLLGKVTGQPVYRQLGRDERAEIPVYASSTEPSSRPEDEAERLAGVVAEHGFGSVKIKIGGRMGQDVDALPGRTEQLIPLMHENLGDEIDLAADANGAFSVSKAILVGRRLETYNYYHFEGPRPFQEIANIARVAAALDLAVAGGEQDNVLPHIQRMVDLGAVDVLQFDVCYLGGVTRTRRVAARAENDGIPCTPHCVNQSLVHVFTLHLVAAQPATNIKNGTPTAQSLGRSKYTNRCQKSREARLRYRSVRVGGSHCRRATSGKRSFR